MLTVLLVSDDHEVQEDMRNALVQYQGELTLASTVESAMPILSERPFDIVITDMDIAEGPAFLGAAKQLQPDARRIVMSGPVGRVAAMRNSPLANDSMSKPCPPKVLSRAIQRASDMQAMQRGQEIKRLVAGMLKLPSLPSSLITLNEALSKDDTSMRDLADVVGRDVAMSSKILHLVNSSYYGLRSQVKDLRQAVAYLGMESLRNLAIVTEAFRAFVPSSSLPPDWMTIFTDHSMAVARVAAQLVPGRVAQYEANVVGMLHDVGKLVVADRAPARLMAVWTDVRNGRPIEEAEVHHLGASYPAIGASLLSRWGMNDRVVEAVSCRRKHWTGPEREPELSDVVHVAHALVDAQEISLMPVNETDDLAVGDAEEESPLCDDYLRRVGLFEAVRLYRDTRSWSSREVPTPEPV